MKNIGGGVAVAVEVNAVEVNAVEVNAVEVLRCHIASSGSCSSAGGGVGWEWLAMYVPLGGR